MRRASFKLSVSWIIFHAFLSSAEFFSKSTFLKNSFRNAIRMSNSLDPDQARRFVRPDLGPICLKRLLADHTRRQRVTTVNHIIGYDKCSKISNINCLTKRPRQTVLTLIRLLLKKMSVQGLPHLLFGKSKPWQQTFILRTERKVNIYCTYYSDPHLKDHRNNFAILLA